MNVEFLVPFPKRTFKAKAQIEARLKELETMWATPTVFCPMDESQHFNASSKPFNVNWLYTKFLTEMQAAKQDVRDMGNETTLLAMDETHVRRQKRGLPVAAMALAGIGVFGSGIMMGNQCSGITGIFGSCQDTGRQNAENIDRLQQHASMLTDFVMEVAQENDEKFFLVYNELKSIHKIQQEMGGNQNRIWEVVEKQFEVFYKNFHVLRDCTQFLYTQQQLNFNYDTVAALLLPLYADIKSYRAAL